MFKVSTLAKSALLTALAVSTTSYATFSHHDRNTTCDGNKELISNGDFSNGWSHHNSWYNFGWDLHGDAAEFTSNHHGLYYIKQHFNTQAKQSYTLSLDVAAVTYGDKDAYLKIYVDGELVKYTKASDIAAENGGSGVAQTYTFDFTPYHSTSYVKVKAYVPHAHFFDKVDDLIVDNISVKANCPDTTPTPCDQSAALDTDDFSDGLHGWYNFDVDAFHNSGWEGKDGAAVFNDNDDGLFKIKRYFNTEARKQNTLTFDLAATSDSDYEAYFKVYIDGVYYLTISASDIAAQNGGDNVAASYSVDFYAHSSHTKVYLKAYVPHDGFRDTVNNLYVDNLVMTGEQSCDTPVTPPPAPTPVCATTDQDTFSNGLEGWYNGGWSTATLGSFGTFATFTKNDDGLYKLKRYFNTTANETNVLSFDLAATTASDYEVYFKVYIDGTYYSKVSATEIVAKAGAELAPTRYRVEFPAQSDSTKIYFKAYVPHDGHHATVNDLALGNIKLAQKIGSGCIGPGPGPR